ncbi:HLA class II histocompatibility antigen, DM beta chain-like [Aythya fuligula]|uniref:HLA class II histocompatibility antigen, DM beta chain-like n=1 Tax=Aythya fuligula TaxID=219594 RepID=A0A6J3EG86_AYTFU|nr:HLA class II histocompatibility antigen, DM beta chain-like [Aythya fuligula]
MPCDMRKKIQHLNVGKTSECAQPQVRIIPAETGNARVPVRLSCHIWGFYPPEVTIIWLHNGDIMEPDDYNPISAIPNGDWSYQTQVSLLVAPVAGDTYTCSVQHVSLQEPLLEDWSPGLMLEVTILVAVATVLMVLGLGLFLAGIYRFRTRPPTPGYTPLPGDNYPAASKDPQTDTSRHRQLLVGAISDPMPWC